MSALDHTVAPTGASLVLRYSAFAAFATVVNLSVQALAFQVYDGPYHLTVALIAGTIAGLVPKYVLDKIWIFADQSGGHVRKFTLYTAMAVATTVIFWTSEILFDWLGSGNYLHYVGAVIGLAIGYIAKYQLDRRFVFTP